MTEEAKTLELPGSIVFFDLAGTLMALDTELEERQARILLNAGRRMHRLVLVTGQDSNDPQVRQLLSLFLSESDIDFIAYTTRGGLRLTRSGTRYKPDKFYLMNSRIEPETSSIVIKIIHQTLEEMSLSPLIPVATLDEVAIRINLKPSRRIEFAQALVQALGHTDKFPPLHVAIEGRTSVFVMRSGVNKKHAVSYELEQLKVAIEPNKKFYYIGNEFIQGGNDREVFGLPVQFLALGGCGEVPSGVQCKTIGNTPEDLYRLLIKGNE